MYEASSRSVLPWPAFLRRAGRHASFGLAIVLAAVSLGTAGYHLVAGLPWVDAFLNAAMILSGMGPVDRLETTGAKLFAALYALFSGVVFIGVMGVLLAPWAHRMLHRFHAERR